MEHDISVRNGAQLEEHAVWDALTELDVILQTEPNEDALTSEQVEYEVSRLHSITAFARATLRAVDPPRIIFDDVDAILAATAGAKSALEQLRSGVEATAQLQAHLTDLQRVTATVMMTSVLAPDTDIMADLHGTRTRGHQILAGFEARIESNEGRCEETSERIEKLKVEISERDKEVARLQLALSETEEAGALLLDEQKATFDTALDKLKQQAHAAKDNQISEAKAETTALLAESAAQIDQQIGQAQAHLGEIEDLHMQVKAIAGALGPDAQAGGFGKFADTQSKAALGLLCSAVLAFLSAAGVGVWLAATADDSIGWGRVVSKLGVTIALVGLGSYLAVQSNEHRSQERFARRRQLDLLALGPFIIELDETQRSDLRIELAKKAFMADGGMESIQRAAGGGTIPTKELAELLKSINSIFGK